MFKTSGLPSMQSLRFDAVFFGTVLHGEPIDENGGFQLGSAAVRNYAKNGGEYQGQLYIDGVEILRSESSGPVEG